MIASEAHFLTIGQQFSFDPKSGPLLTVDARLIDREGNDLLIYADDRGYLHGHHFDHTSVWVKA